MGTPWKGLLAPINKPTGDGRRMAVGAFRWRELPLGLKWQRSDAMGHDDSVIIGSTEQINLGTLQQAIDSGWISADDVTAKMGPDDMGVWGAGELFDDVDASVMPRLAEDVAEARLLTDRKVIGPSVDAGAATAILVEVGSDEPLTEQRFEELWLESMDTGGDMPVELLFTDYEIAAATLVSIPAFAEARPFQLGLPALVAAVTGSTDLPVAPYTTEWDQQAATTRIFDAATNADGEVDTALLGKAFLYRDAEADPTTKGAYRLGFADMVDGELMMVPAGVQACAGGHGVDAADIPDSDKTAIRTKICTLYGKCQDVHDQMPDCPFDNASAASSERTALAAALTAAAALTPADVFARPDVAPPYQLLTVHEPRPGEAFRRVDGYAAAFGTCHVGFRGVCVVPPQSTTDYAVFHRYIADTPEGPVPVGRITTGHGRTGTGCTHLTCRGKDDHACDDMDLAATIKHYDDLHTVAHVRAHEFDGVGVWVTGVLADGVDQADLRVLARQKVSGDWRDVGGSLEMVELLALAREEPGFPVPHAGIRHGRQVSLTAAVPRPPAGFNFGPIDYSRLAAELSTRLTMLLPTALRTQGFRVQFNTTPLLAAGEGMMPMPEGDQPPPEDDTTDQPQQHTGAMVAFRMSEDDAARLAVEGGEPAAELHATRAYLGEAADWTPEQQAALIDAMRAVAATIPPFTADAFNLAAFNPGTEDCCIVLGLGGDQLADHHDAVMAGLEPFANQMPDQHRPHAEHVTLIYTPDLARLAELTDRAGAPITFDRLRVAFAGVATDLPLTGMPMGEPVETAASLMAEVAGALDALDAAARAEAAAALTAEIEGMELAGV
jgi:hypothetical protein